MLINIFWTKKNLNIKWKNIIIRLIKKNMNKYIRIILILIWFLFLTLVVYASVTIASNRKSSKLPWQWVPNWFYDSSHNVWTSYQAETRYTCISGTCNSTQSNNWIVSDLVTGLIWQSWYAPGTYTWQWAKDYCTNLTLWWYSDWRLPTLNELQSIVDFTKNQLSIDSNYFSTYNYYFWASNEFANNTTKAWSLHFAGWARMEALKTTSNYYARCAR